MPIYEFECTSCGKRFDRLQKLSDPDPTDCPNCGAAKLHRCVTAPSFRLSGSGWYETDFKKDGDKKRNLTGSDEAPKPAAEATPKADAAVKSDANVKAAPKTAPQSGSAASASKPNSAPPAAPKA